jgi:hypothetical protein
MLLAREKERKGIIINGGTIIGSMDLVVNVLAAIF